MATYTRRATGTPLEDTFYFTHDHLGSIDSVTNQSAVMQVRLSFDALGKRRNEAGWSGAVPSGDWTKIAATTRRGYTEHELIDNLTLTHMNGRVYDQTIGRFASADPFVQAPFYSQSLNRFAYVWNNPLTLIDPSGFGAEIKDEDEQIANDPPAAPPIGEIMTTASRIQPYRWNPPPLGLAAVNIVAGFWSWASAGVLEEVFSTSRRPPEPSNSGTPGPGSPQEQKIALDTIKDVWCGASASVWIAISNLGPAAFNTANERSLVHRYFEGPATPYRLSADEFAAARSFVATSPGLVRNPSAPDANGVYTAQVLFGHAYVGEGNDALDGLLGTATGRFQNGELIGVSDHFDFDPKDRGSVIVNLSVAAMRASATMNCRNPGGFPVTGGR